MFGGGVIGEAGPELGHWPERRRRSARIEKGCKERREERKEERK